MLTRVRGQLEWDYEDMTDKTRLVTFHREDSATGKPIFYPIEIPPDETIEQHVELNPGTLKVKDALTGKTLWEPTP